MISCISSYISGPAGSTWCHLCTRTHSSASHPRGPYVQLWFPNSEKSLSAWETTFCLKDLVAVKYLKQKLLKWWHDHLGQYLLQKGLGGWVLLTKTPVLDTAKVLQSFLEESEITNASRIYLSHRYHRPCSGLTWLVQAQGDFSGEWRQIHKRLKTTSHNC